MRKQKGMNRFEAHNRHEAAKIAEQQFKIERGVELPPPIRIDRAIKYPYDQMEVGHSMFIPDVKAATIHASLARFKSHPRGIGKKYAIRTTTEKGVTGVRVWRTV